jgi:hypothetical protein
MDQDVTDQAILGLLVADRALWAVEEVTREIGSPLAVADSLARLRGAGLVHRCGDFVFAARAAVRFNDLA